MENTEAPTTGRYLRAADYQNKVVVVTSGRIRAGKFGPQFVLVTGDEARSKVGISLKSGIGKGIQSGKLKMPLRLVGTQAITPTGLVYTWDLAPKGA